MLPWTQQRFGLGSWELFLEHGNNIFSGENKLFQLHTTSWLKVVYARKPDIGRAHVASSKKLIVTVFNAQTSRYISGAQQDSQTFIIIQIAVVRNVSFNNKPVNCE